MDLEKWLAARTKWEGECLIWQWSVGNNGYPGTRYRGSDISVSRVIWMEVNGPIPKGMVVMHTCDTPKCCNIQHLRLGTYSDNNKDTWAKGRRKRIQ